MDEALAYHLPPPPEVLAEPNVVEHPTDVPLHRVHSRQSVGNEFNPCKGAPTRFAPFRDDMGLRVPSLYAGETPEAAIYETVFHDIPVESDDPKTVPRGAVEDRRHSILLPDRPLLLASLRAPDLRRWRIRRESLIASLPDRYPRTVLWAKAIHDQHEVDGLIWTSRQCVPAAAMLLFGDRVAAGVLTIVTVRHGRDESFQEDVRRAGERGGITITL